MQSGDFDGDGKSEQIAWDSVSKEISISSYSAGSWKKLTSHPLENFPTQMIASDLDGDRKAELIIGEGLRGYNPKTGPQTDVQLRIYRPLAKDGWVPNEIFRQVTERPEFTSLESIDLDGDKQQELLFAYFAEKYQVNLRVARQSGNTWKIEELPQVRMGMNITAGDVLQAALAGRANCGNAGDGVGQQLAAPNDAQASRAFRHEHVAVRQPRHAPRSHESFRDRDDAERVELRVVNLLGGELRRRGGQHDAAGCNTER